MNLDPAVDRLEDILTNHSSLIQVERLYRYYGALCAVNDVSFTVCRGEVLGLLGPNGAGKSTTLQMISGNLAPSAGRVSIAGYDMQTQPRAAKAQLGYLPEQPPLYPEFTVDEYLSYSARLHRIARRQLAAAVSRVKQRCGLSSVGRRLIASLSKGFQQRVGIAQAIIHTPEVVILDEPTVGLDPIQIREIRALIGELASEHSVILSTHILPEVQAICNRVLIIHEGKLLLDDSIAGLRRRMQASSLVLVFRRPPEVGVLESLAGVMAVDQLDEGHVRLHYEPQHNPTDNIMRCALAGDWGLSELRPERLSLEQVFIEITGGQAPGGTEAVA